MRIVQLAILHRIAVLIAIASSAVLAIEYEGGTAPLFCGSGGGCDQVRQSSLAEWIAGTLGLPLPNFAVFAFMAMLGASLFVSSLQHVRIFAGFAATGGLIGAALIGAQFTVVGAVCPWCMVVDTAAIVAAITALLILRDVTRDASKLAWIGPEAGGVVLAAWAIAGALATSSPFIWQRFPIEPAAPPAITALDVPGKVTLVTFTDFECPYCRMLYPTIHAIEEQVGDRVQVVKVMVPLDFHPGALPAAKAYLCMPEAQRSALAGKLYEIPPETLTTEGVTDIAVALGADRAALVACYDAPATAAKLAADRALYKALGGRGLPMTYVGGTVILGAVSEEVERAVLRHLTPSPLELPVPAMYGVLGLAFAGAGLVTWARARRGPPPVRKADDDGDVDDGHAPGDV